MIIIGITGTLGAGKGTIVEYLINKYGFSHYSVRDFIIEEILRRDLPISRDTMVNVANDLRRAHHPGHIVEELYKKASMQGTDSIIESIRTVGEIDTLKNSGEFYLFAVDADPEIRYKRIRFNRKGVTDKISFEEFLENEKREMESDDPNKQNLSAVIARADFPAFQNNGTIEELQKQIDEVMEELKMMKSA